MKQKYVYMHVYLLMWTFLQFQFLKFFTLSIENCFNEGSCENIEGKKVSNL